MNDKNIKLVGAPEEAPPPQQPTFPRTNVQFGPLGGGFAIQILLADDIAITKAFNAQAEDEICNILIQRRKEVKQRQVEQLAVIKHVNTHRND